jgi:Domain of unknown function (DUF4258)
MEFVRWAARENMSLVRFGSHATEQMAARGLVVRDVERVLRSGDTVGLPEAGNNPGEVKLVITHQPKGSREVAVATIVVKDDRKIFVKTVMWKDER